MSADWYFREMNEEQGPMAGSELRRHALQGRVTPDTPVRQGLDGQWTTARHVRGLFDESAAPAAHSSFAGADSAGGHPFAADSTEHVNPFAYPEAAASPASDNPFASPRTMADAHVADVYDTSAVFLGYAGFWKRFAALIIDQVVLFFGGAVVGGLLGFIIGAMMGAQGAAIQDIEAIAGGVGNLVGILIAWLYHALLESSSRQASLGKMALGIKVTDLEGRRISFARATGRHFGKIVSGILLGMGFVMAGVTERKQALHDSMASCLVVNSR